MRFPALFPLLLGDIGGSRNMSRTKSIVILLSGGIHLKVWSRGNISHGSPLAVQSSGN